MSRNATRDVMMPHGDVGDMCIESVSDTGEVTVRFPAGWCMQFEISPDLIQYYRRLVRR